MTTEIVPVAPAPVSAPAPAEQPVVGIPLEEPAVVANVAPAPAPTPAPTLPPFDPSVLEGVSKEDLAKIPAFREILTEREQAVQRSAEQATEEKLTQARQNWLQRGGYVQNLRDHVTQSLANNNPVDGSYLERIADEMWIGTSYEANQAIENVLASTLPPDFTITRQEMEHLERVKNDVNSGRKPLDELIKARWDMSVRAYVENTLKPQIRVELRAEQQSAAQTQTIRDAEAVRVAQPGPTVGLPGGTAGPMLRTQAEVRQAHAEGRLSNQRMRQIRDSGELARLPAN